MRNHASETRSCSSGATLAVGTESSMDDSALADLVSELDGNRAEQAWHNLVDMGPGIVPRLCAMFAGRESAGVRTAIVEIVAQHRRAEDVAFLTVALSDPEETVWQAAIDGLLGQPAQAVVGILTGALAREREVGDQQSRRALFLAEAVAEMQMPTPFAVAATRSVSG